MWFSTVRWEIESGLTPQAISLLERGERRRPHRYTVAKLAEALSLTGMDLARFEVVSRGASRSRTRSQLSPYDLPTPPTPLIEREQEVATISRLLRQADVRLLTLSGPGGVRKTRLAVLATSRAPLHLSGERQFVSGAAQLASYLSLTGLIGDPRFTLGQ